jgi:hypothetical protein
MPRSRVYLLLSIAVGLLTFAFYVGLEASMRPYALDGIYFQQWTSETMMQTLAIEDLRRAPIESLWYLHMQPPLLDTIRAIVAHFANASEGIALVREVDQRLYLVWALAAAMLATAMFRWLARLTNTTIAFLATLLFMIHPGVISYATLLDGTFLSAVCIFLTYFELWKLRRDPNRSILPLTFLFLALALLRTLFQWPALIVFAASLILMKVPRRSIVVYLTICGVVLGSYLVKQYAMFGTTSSFGWRGLNMCRSIGSSERYDMGTYHAAIHSLPLGTTEEEKNAPAALSRRIKSTGTPNFNHLSFLSLNREMVDYCAERVRQLSLRELLEAYRLNSQIYFSPSSHYVTPNEIVVRLPWREGYEKLFSTPFLPAALGVALLLAIRYVRSDSITRYVGLILPGVYIFAVSVLGERGENMRLKFLLEPLFYLFIIFTLYRTFAAMVGPRIFSLNRWKR